MRFRSAANQDVAALGALKLRASLALGEHLEQLEALPEARAFPPEHLAFAVVAEVEGTIVGFVTVLPEAEALALAAGARVLRVVANSPAFYVACGFEAVGEVETLFAPAPVMEKRLCGDRACASR